jgi:hypothetical protein
LTVHESQQNFRYYHFSAIKINVTVLENELNNARTDIMTGRSWLRKMSARTRRAESINEAIMAKEKELNKISTDHTSGLSKAPITSKRE